MGTPEFAVASLEALLKNKFEVVGVVTVPDKPAGRGQQMQQSAVKKFALEKNLRLLQPEKLKSPDFIAELEALNADLQLVVAFRMLPEVVWNMPAQGTINLHASLLPKYRGAAPINWAIINGETETGVTTFKLKQEIDTGNILFNQKVAINKGMTAGELHDSLMNIGADLIVKTVNVIEESLKQKTEITFIPQNEGEVCHAPKLYKADCRIDWNKSGETIENLIRGLSPYPTAFTELKINEKAPQTLKIFRATFQTAKHKNTNGSLTTDNKTFLNIFCEDGYIEIIDIQLQGKKRMLLPEFLRGFKIPLDCTLH
jgi:methionyl-tRNA formyltransferase